MDELDSMEESVLDFRKFPAPLKPTSKVKRNDQSKKELERKDDEDHPDNAGDFNSDSMTFPPWQNQRARSNTKPIAMMNISM
jgi:hypothetical protein